MNEVISQIIIHQREKKNCEVYLKLQSSDVYVTQVALLPSDKITKFQMEFDISLQDALSIELWSYTPFKLLQKWNFDQKALSKLENKYLIQEDEWTLFIKKKTAEGLNKQNRLRIKSFNESQSKLRDMQEKTKPNKQKLSKPNLHLLNQNSQNTRITLNEEYKQKQLFIKTSHCLQEQERTRQLFEIHSNNGSPDARKRMKSERQITHQQTKLQMMRRLAELKSSN